MKRLDMLFAGLTVLVFAFAQMASAALTNRYVDKNSATPAEPYDAWANAAISIQTAIDYAYAGETVLVAAATYDTGGITNWPTGTVLTNRVVINKAITVRSEHNDPTNTIIKGAGPKGPAAVRCVFITNGAVLIGFTLTNGATLALNYPATGSNDNHNGGGIWGTNNFIISNCVIAGNSAAYYAGGVYYGNLFNCIVADNSAASRAGGAYFGNYSNCTFAGNSAPSGGGIHYGNLYNCTLISNTAVNNGGGAYYGNLYNCTLIGNTAGASGGAMFYYGQFAYNCLIIGNKAANGGGVYGGYIYNSTIVGNYASTSGGGATSNGPTYGKLYNCIVYFNDAPAYPNYGEMVHITNCCTTPLPAIGTGNTDSDPLFVANGSNYGTNHVAGNYRLNAKSPCVNTGTNGSWTTAAPYDLDRRVRIRYGTVDMGAYEKIYEGTIYSFH